ncbi:MAG: ferrous iron transport protein A [Phycisphaeraceae bacterium]|nr:ferrous iron transport protein A [Phycisphaerales bacterium]QOJ17906.1 MAG: ferrous iron transport protein A [Phycisphaeraceae bacterium]
MQVSTLDTLSRGARGEILAVGDRSGSAGRLRCMGLREGVVVEVMADCDPTMLRVEGCCLAVGRELLRDVTICRCGCEKEDAASQALARSLGAKRRGPHA